MSPIRRLTDGRAISTAELRELLKQRAVRTGGFVSLRRGTASVELLQDDRPPVTVTVQDRD